jgi:DNA-binding NarL/FixJ family response regulator
LYVSEAAVKKHLNSMLQKFAVNNRTRLAKEITDLQASIK